MQQKVLRTDLNKDSTEKIELVELLNEGKKSYAINRIVLRTSEPHEDIESCVDLRSAENRFKSLVTGE